MKRRLTFLFILFISVFTLNAHDKITFQNKESFNSSCGEGMLCSQFNLGEIKDKTDLKSANQFIKENPTLIKAERRDSQVGLTVFSTTESKIIYQKLFLQLGLQEIEILEGDAKGVYSVDEFLNLYFH